MFIVVADHKLVLVTDVDDVAWQYAEEIQDPDIFEDPSEACEYAYSEEMYEDDFDENGLYTTTEGDVITLAEYQNAERYLR